MPTYPLAFPNILPARVDVVRVPAQFAVRSPYSFVEQVQDFGGRMFRLTIEMQQMGRGQAATMGAWLRDLDGLVGTFTFDLDPWCVGWSPAPGVRTFRLADPDVAWSVRLRQTFDLRFTADESVT